MPNATVAAADPGLPFAISPDLRRRVETQIEELITLLDMIDNDVDLEGGQEDDLCVDDEGEPTLGAPEAVSDHEGGMLIGNQERWARGWHDRFADGEAEDLGEDFEDGADGEPSLARPEAAEGSHAVHLGSDDDREIDPAESGVADADALALVRDEQAAAAHIRKRTAAWDEAMLPHLMVAADHLQAWRRRLPHREARLVATHRWHERNGR